MIIDPDAWMFTLPLTIGLLCLARVPADHVGRRWWKQVNELEQFAWDWMGLAPPQIAGVSAAAVRRFAFNMVVAALAAGSLASLAAHLGWVGS